MSTAENPLHPEDSLAALILLHSSTYLATVLCYGNTPSQICIHFDFRTLAKRSKILPGYGTRMVVVQVEGMKAFSLASEGIS